jgi:hypothetical protein
LFKPETFSGGDLASVTLTYNNRGQNCVDTIRADPPDCDVLLCADKLTWCTTASATGPLLVLTGKPAPVLFRPKLPRNPEAVGFVLVVLLSMVAAGKVVSMEDAVWGVCAGGVSR